MAQEVSNILSQLLFQLVNEIKSNLPHVTGKTAESLEVRVLTSGTPPFQSIKGGIYGSIAVQVLETGRGPTRSGAATGSPTLQQSILAWIQAASIEPEARNGKTMTQVQLSWAIAVKIHKEGNELFRNGGHSGVLSNVLTPSRLNTFAEVFNSQSSRAILSGILKQIQQ